MSTIWGQERIRRVCEKFPGRYTPRLSVVHPLDHPKLISQLIDLERRRTWTGGNRSCSRGRDDITNAGCAVIPMRQELAISIGHWSIRRQGWSNRTNREEASANLQKQLRTPKMAS
jgi:hypothetical protein